MIYRPTMFPQHNQVQVIGYFLSALEPGKLKVQGSIPRAGLIVV